MAGPIPIQLGAVTQAPAGALTSAAVQAGPMAAFGALLARFLQTSRGSTARLPAVDGATQLAGTSAAGQVPAAGAQLSGTLAAGQVPTTG